MEGTTMDADGSPRDKDAFDLSLPQPCLRHITSIQIRNLSPFPARDSLASALTQKSSILPRGSGKGSVSASDDADILLGQRRKRRISSASTHTFRSVHSDHDYDGAASHEPNKHTQKRTSSRASLHASSKQSSSPSTIRQIQTSSAEIRQIGTAAKASLPEDSVPSWQMPSQSSSSWISDTLNSQKQLEDVIWSRLVDTFLTIHPPADNTNSPVSPTPGKSRGTKSTPLKRLSGSVDFNHLLPSSPPTRRSRRTASISTTSANMSCHNTLSPSVSFFSSINIDTTSKTSDSPLVGTFPQSPPLTPPPPATPPSTLVPIFMSPFHRPSTNPKFMLDSQDPAFARWTDLSADRVIIRLWARIGVESDICTGSKGKEKVESLDEKYTDLFGNEWKILCEWDISLSDLVPLPDDLVEHPWKLPSNTLVVTLSTSNRPHYIPSSLLGVTSLPSRPESPNYNSDTEISRRLPPSKTIFSLDRGRQRKSRRQLKSANLNELVKLASLQASLLDARNLLQDVLENCNRLMKSEPGTVLRRESSEREYRLRCLQEQRDLLDDHIKSACDNISSHRQQLSQRRMRLVEARALHEDDLLTEFDAGVRLADERKRVQGLRTRIKPVQTSLLSTLAFIFPIELLSPPDLLYTILGVPLPIPLQGNDPAPPLSLPHEPAVTEDNVATSLGYAALLVHLMAALLCQRLVYPITYVGSRSLVKDPISAMMGPRMFPLYSKGVDTYRFEYAVFLLNKDIEMLMAERNLRALDLRHTLPNLKNLLLTLTSGEGALPRPSPSVVSITPGLQSPSPYAAETTESGNPEPPPLSLKDDEVNPGTTPKGRVVGLPTVDESADAVNLAESGPNGSLVTGSYAAQGASDISLSSGNEDRSGTAVGTNIIRPRLPRIQIQSYLGLPLSSMWRGRGASSSSAASSSKAAETEDASLREQTSESVSPPAPKEDPEDGTEETSGSSDEYEDDDRCTVRGPSVPTTPVPETRSRRGSIAPESLFDNLKARVHLRGAVPSGMSSEIEKRLDSAEDGDAVVDPAR
ncbi:hypothetical protein A7U60_g3382 [Sanghuangporus baumii]|uniref:Autophagy-related protein 14 n=1 Tax=Sanghuangporus baumii TaxID=108892 RepID=A0A9Q5I0Q1_SANBA|nr:hypothetical protein A7U60_g3382 [Sanghuangporus baumii]